mmetsp:Transcript_25787/g.79327  ORF Transcript_25787/g.79327 Transcript_25787/m.79327 type:complete len:248 (-) Transcript_25787:94-837(-)
MIKTSLLLTWWTARVVDAQLGDEDTFCAGAQMLVAAIDVAPEVVLYDNISAYEASDATPWQGAYDLPFTVPQYTVYGDDQKALGFLCKLKSADGLNDADPNFAATNTNCSFVSAAVFEAVLENLTDDDDEDEPDSDEEEFRDDVCFETETVYSGPQYTQNLPNVPFAYVSTVDDKLHFLARELYVFVHDRSFFVGPNKKGVNYCNLAAPAYMAALLLGNASAPVCDPPPPFSQNPFDPNPSWNCSLF